MEPALIPLPQQLAGIRHIALDMDGTIYKGNTVFAATLPFLQLLRQAGIGYTFLTNNPSRNNRDYQAKLLRLGIPIQPDQIYTSIQATIEFLRRNWPATNRLFVLGTPALAEAFTAAQFTLLPDDPGERPEAVIVGFDTTLTYRRLCRAAWWIAKGVPYLATNPDCVCPNRRTNRAGRLRRHYRRPGKSDRPLPGRRAGQTGRGDAGGHIAAARPASAAIGHGGRPSLHRHGDGAPHRGAGRAGADGRSDRGSSGGQRPAAGLGRGGPGGIGRGPAGSAPPPVRRRKRLKLEDA